MADTSDVFQSVKGLVLQRPALQNPGHDELLNKNLFPGQPGDRRLILDVTALRQMLAIAESSPTQRVVLHNVKLCLEQYRGKDGHVYEIWAFEGGPISPEFTQAEASVLARGPRG